MQSIDKNIFLLEKETLSENKLSMLLLLFFFNKTYVTAFKKNFSDSFILSRAKVKFGLK